MIGVVCFIALAAGIWATAAIMRGNEPPRLNDNAVVLTKFVRSSGFEQLPFEQSPPVQDRDQGRLNSHRGVGMHERPR